LITPLKQFAATAGVPPAMSPKREQPFPTLFYPITSVRESYGFTYEPINTSFERSFAGTLFANVNNG